MTVIGIIALAAIFIFVVMYNSIIGKKNQILNAQGGLDAQLKQRYDLIPNLVASVKKFMAHEQGVLEEIVRLRSQALGMRDLSEKQGIEAQISQKLGGLMVQVEQYPELKSSQNFLNLQENIYRVEENIAASRRFFNAAVVDFNNALEMFPSNLVGKMMGLKSRQVFEIPEIQRKNVDVAKMLDS